MANKIKKYLSSFIVMLFLFIFVFSTVKASNNLAATVENNKGTYDTTMKQDILCLMMAYPEYITDVNRDETGRVYIILKSGSKILYDDRKTKNSEEKLAYPDLQDMMEQIYPLTPVSGLMSKDFDPGRIRVYNLLGEVYGKSSAQIQGNLRGVGYGNLQFNGKNKAADSLKDAMKELVQLSKQRRDISSCLYPINGTFNYRCIAGTNRLSPHAYGIAIDLAIDSRDYWKWATPKQGEQRIQSYSKDLVKVFEEHNFIWGGKWSHFDILHFEYRPEIILKARYFGKSLDVKEKWYEKVPKEQPEIKEYINKINKALE